ncbi:ABC transporter ATP-binding protein [Rhodopseudomonas palustris]|uniref:ABC transporter related n=1 Tax=Rhodopseudomonas palustris (strain BisB18) TaxID=316056 RepID=Q21AK0_RHOPB
MTAIAEVMLKARGIDTFYGPSHILRGVNFHVDRGETVSLLGRNGMGKTTLLRTLMGLLKPKRGSILLNGRDMTDARPNIKARAGMGFVPEGRGIFPNLSVEENLLFAERPGPEGQVEWTPEAIYEMFPRLADRRKIWGNLLSGGEQQMLTIGRVLLSNPTLLLIDEATEGLAPKMRDEIWKTMRLIATKGIAIVIVDKNLDDLVELVDRHVILTKGEVVFEGTSEQLLADQEMVKTMLGV